MYRDELEEMYPDAADVIATTWDLLAGGGTEDRPHRWWSSSDERVRVFETYYRELKRIPGKKRKTRWVWYRCVWTPGGFLEVPEECQYRDDKGRAFNPMWIVRAYLTRDNDTYGAVRNMISPQDEINKRSSKALHLLHTQRVIAEQGALQSPEEFQQQAMRPDGVMEVQPGRLSDNSVQLVDNTPLVAAQVQMLQDAKAEIDAVTGELGAESRLGLLT
ncbi:MAG: hypothetical protein HC927_03290, partial [Deltaproteobacteria bacterium]|nr:hypothetical protein [Deltaproteobacteria bacterium]